MRLMMLASPDGPALALVQGDDAIPLAGLGADLPRSVLAVEIERIGVLRNPVVDEAAA